MMWTLFAAMWVAMSALMVFTLHNDILRALLIHGKVRQDAQLRRSGMIGALLRMEMRKSSWIYFYLAGAMYNVGIALALVAAPQHALVQRVLAFLQSPLAALSQSTLEPVEIRAEAIAVITLLGVQDTRRFFESAFITEFGDAKMHVALMGAGLVHYLGVAPAVLSAPQSRCANSNDVWSVHPLLSAAAVVLFLYGSYQQYRHNNLLAQQKRANGGKHVLPRGAWFDRVLCPLYSAELLIYFAFVLLCGLTNPMINLIFGWVALNQSICARFGKQWYHNKFRSDDKLVKWALVPGVW